MSKAEFHKHLCCQLVQPGTWPVIQNIDELSELFCFNLLLVHCFGCQTMWETNGAELSGGWDLLFNYDLKSTLFFIC